MRNRTRLLGRIVGLTLTSAALAAPHRLAAQGTAHVAPVQDLRFGQLFPGVPATVTPGDVAQRGELQVEGRGKYRIQFIVPAEMVSVGGATLPLRFGAGDGVLVRGSAGASQAFDPTMGAEVTFGGSIRDAQIFLGGTALPGAGQEAGAYTATITVLMARN